ncbi:MAG: AI-2E family transporter [Asticcacaulis sp.]|nr:AI-2E family transporter [Asticcacaulis sp.]
MSERQPGLTYAFMQKVGFVILAIAGALLAYHLMSLWVIIFGAIVIAVVLRAIAEPLMTYARLSAPLAVAAAVLLVVGLVVLTFYLFGREIVVQVQTLWTQLPAAWDALQARLIQWGLGDEVNAQVKALGQQAGGVASQIPSIAGNILGVVANFLVALVGGIVLAVNPGKYRDGVVFLFPASYKPRVRDAMNVAGHALRKWFIGQLISMLLVGVLTGLGLWLLHVPSAVALGMVSGLAQFVPIVGPVISAGPGLLLAGVSGWTTFLLALAVYVGVSQLESNIITPMVQNRIASVPMVLTLFAVIGFAGLLGPVGVLYAMPLTVVFYTLVMRFYKGEDVSEDEDAPGSSAGPSPAPAPAKPGRRKR